MPRKPKPGPYQCCEHCKDNCPDQTAGHIQTCPEDHCKQGRTPIQPAKEKAA